MAKKKSTSVVTEAIGEDAVTDVLAATAVVSVPESSLSPPAANSTPADVPVIIKSQYTSPPVTLRIGAELQPYYVPEVLLQSLARLPRSVSGDTSIELQDVDTDIGHVIVHFLYTGRYQLLEGLHSDNDATTASARAKSEFKKAILAFVAAKKYKLTTLQQLAKQEIIRCGDEMSMSHAAHAVSKDTLTELQTDAAWLQDLILQKAEKAFEEDDAVFSAAGFFSNVKNLKIAKLLARHVAKLYRERILQQRELIDTLRNRTDVAAEVGIEDGLEEVAGQAVREAADDTVVEAGEQAGQAAAEKVLEGERATTTSTTQAVDGPLPASQSVDTSPGDVDYPTAEKSAPQFPRERLPDAPTAPAQPLLEPEVAAESIDVAIACPTPSADKEWGVPPIAATPPNPDQIHLEEEEAMEAQFLDSTGPFKGLKKKERKILRLKLRAEAAARREEAEAAMQGVPAALAPSTQVEWGSSAMRDAAPFAAVAQDKPQDPFVGLSKLQKKKLEKRLLAEAAVKAQADKGKMPQSPEADVATGSDLIEPAPDSAVEMDVSDDENCPFRYEHLTQNGGWKDCKQCELYMQRIAIKLHSAGLPDVNGLVATKR